MNRVSVTCNRCGQEVAGAENEVGTVGFYRVGNPPWQKYGRVGETVVCDRCMWETAEYVADYGSQKSLDDIIIHVEGWRKHQGERGIL